jgi:hypothetical protein
MKGKIMELFSISAKEGKYFNDKEGFIEVESCPVGVMFCTEHLAFINKKMRFSRSHWINKNYLLAIEELKLAYNKTTELNQTSCMQCADLFRSTITNSLETIQEDLHEMTTGFFKARRFQASYELATRTLKEFKENS